MSCSRRRRTSSTHGLPAHQAETFGPKGQVYDGWETRRRREAGDDQAIVRLGLPGVISGVVVDTAFFKGQLCAVHLGRSLRGAVGIPAPLNCPEWTGRRS